MKNLRQNITFAAILCTVGSIIAISLVYAVRSAPGRVHLIKADSQDAAEHTIVQKYNLAASNIMSASMGIHPRPAVLHPLEQQFINFVRSQSRKATAQPMLSSFGVSPEPEKWLFQAPDKVTVILEERLFAGIGRGKAIHLADHQYMLSGYYKDIWACSGGIWRLQSSVPLPYQLMRDGKLIVLNTSLHEQL